MTHGHHHFYQVWICGTPFQMKEVLNAQKKEDDGTNNKKT